MAHKSSDGQEFTNHSSMRHHEARIKGGGSDKSATPPSQGSANDDSPQGAVSAHGVADEITIKNEKGKSTVTSKHKDGHKHSSVFSNPGDANKAAATLSGVQPEESPADQQAAVATPNPASGAAGIPGLTS